MSKTARTEAGTRPYPCTQCNMDEGWPICSSACLRSNPNQEPGACSECGQRGWHKLSCGQRARRESGMSVTQRREGETELDFLRRKQTAWGLWQGDALERMSQQDQTIDALQARVRELEGTLAGVKEMAQEMAGRIIHGMAEMRPGDLSIDHAPHINAMAAAGMPEYLGGQIAARHKDLRSSKPRKT
jgi:hypothetical protein